MRVLIAGGGPAGSIAAIALRRQGADVIVFEAVPFPRQRPGETLPAAIEPLFQQIGLSGRLNSAGFMRTAGVFIHWNEKQNYRSPGSDYRGIWRDYHANRAQLDSLLLDAAREAGVEVLQPCRASAILRQGTRICGIRTATREFRADYVLDASGGLHWLARRLPLPVVREGPPIIARYGICSKSFAVPPQVPRLESDSEGWFWVNPIERECYSWVRVRWDGRLTAANWLPPLLQGSIAMRPALSADVTWRRVIPAAGPGYFCLGDAAFVVDPLSGHGVLRAVMSALYATFLLNAVNRGLPEHKAAEEYNTWISQWFEHERVNLQRLYAETPGAATFGSTSRIAAARTQRQ